jgi:hypothetical protein
MEYLGASYSVQIIVMNGTISSVVPAVKKTRILS